MADIEKASNRAFQRYQESLAKAIEERHPMTEQPIQTSPTLEEQIAEEKRRILAYMGLRSGIPATALDSWAEGLASHMVRNRVTIEQPQTTPPREWLVNAIEVFMGSIPAEADTGWSYKVSNGLADHILGNWLLVERAQVDYRALWQEENRMHQEVADEADDLKTQVRALKDAIEAIQERAEAALEPFTKEAA